MKSLIISLAAGASFVTALSAFASTAAETDQSADVMVQTKTLADMPAPQAFADDICWVAPEWTGN